MDCECYVRVSDIDETLEVLSSHDGRARVIAGGTDLMLGLRFGREHARVLVDISDVAELRYIRRTDGQIAVGPVTTHAELAASPLVRQAATALAAAAASVGSPQIRNVGTVGGNIVNALPAADTAVALLALDAQIEITDQTGMRTSELIDLYVGVGQSTLDPSREILTGIRFQAPTCSSFQRLARRKAFALPVLNAAVALWLDEGGLCRGARVCVAPVGPKPWRALGAEEALKGRPLTEETILAAGQAATEEAVCRDSIRGCSEYREAMVKVLVERALRASAGQSSPQPGDSSP
ncbi:MAG: xanthine dehydrogenase family protein subunit M [Thermoleophilia bacterium]|nr:xanthine dehydrogenase family protein subunit M [Thermoleophilia bacterium]